MRDLKSVKSGRCSAEFTVKHVRIVACQLIQLTRGVLSLHIEEVQVLHHPGQQNSCLRVFHIGYHIVDGETMVDPIDSVLKVCKGIKMTTKHNRVLGGENGMRRIGPHQPGCRQPNNRKLRPMVLTNGSQVSEERPLLPKSSPRWPD